MQASAPAYVMSETIWMNAMMWIGRIIVTFRGYFKGEQEKGWGRRGYTS